MTIGICEEVKRQRVVAGPQIRPHIFAGKEKAYWFTESLVAATEPGKEQDVRIIDDSNPKMLAQQIGEIIPLRIKVRPKIGVAEAQDRLWFRGHAGLLHSRGG